MLKQPPSKPALNHSSVPPKKIATALLGLLSPRAIASKTSGKQAKQVTDQPASDLQPAAAQLDTASAETPEAKELPKKPSSARARRLRTGAYVAITLGLLGSGTAFAFTQVAPPELQAAIVPQRQTPTPPVSSPNDPEVQTFTSTRDLFLTNQIFYRKVEALAGAAAPGKSASKSTAQADRKTTTKSADDQAKAKADQAKADKAAQSERVTASAPPAPAAEKSGFKGTTIDSVLEMRVAVANDVSAIGFATSSSGTVTDLDGNVLKTLPAETASLASISNGLTIDGTPVAGGVFWIYPEDGGYVAIGDSWYRGRVLVALRDRGLIAVNYVLLGDYLYSVVGSEMSPDWSIESLKAQAVAARSYALTHNISPASEAYFDLDNTPRFQAYRGISREANTTQAAVQSTSGEFISREGGIVESLYAASQDIVDDAHSGSGMSQLGAKDLAEQGYGYDEILAHYYPGTALGRIETDAE